MSRMSLSWLTCQQEGHEDEGAKEEEGSTAMTGQRYWVMDRHVIWMMGPERWWVVYVDEECADSPPSDQRKNLMVFDAFLSVTFGRGECVCEYARCGIRRSWRWCPSTGHVCGLHKNSLVSLWLKTYRFGSMIKLMCAAKDWVLCENRLRCGWRWRRAHTSSIVLVSRVISACVSWLHASYRVWSISDWVGCCEHYLLPNNATIQCVRQMV